MRRVPCLDQFRRVMSCLSLTLLTAAINRVVMDMLSKKIVEIRQADAEAEAQLARQDAAFRAAAEKYADAEKYLTQIKTELQAYEEADRLRPSVGGAIAIGETDEADGSVTGKKRGGRKPGSISRKWREALSDLVSAGNKPLNQEQFYLLTRGRLGLAEASVRERVRQYAAAGILIETGGCYVVSNFAIEQWKLDAVPRADLSSGIFGAEPIYPRSVEMADNEKAPH